MGWLWWSDGFVVVEVMWLLLWFDVKFKVVC